MIEIKVVLEAGDSLKELVKLLTASTILLQKQAGKEEKKPGFMAEVAKDVEAKQKAGFMAAAAKALKAGLETTKETEPTNTTGKPEPTPVEPENPVGGIIVDPKPEEQKPGAAEAFVKEVKAEQGPTAAEVKRIAVKKIQSGKRDAVKGLIKKYGSEKIDEIPADRLPDFVKELEAI